MDTAIYALPMATLEARTHGPDGRRFLLELYTRFSYPVACLVLMLVGVPLGVISRRGGKSSGLVYTVLLVLLYYFLSYTGIALGRQDKLPPFLAVWMANLLFAAVGSFLLWQMASGGRVLSAIANLVSRTPKPRLALKSNGAHLTGLLEKLQPRSVRLVSRGMFPRILDAYVVREFFGMFLLVLSGFVMLMLVFTFFELVGDIVRNHIPLTTVGEYLVNLAPDMLYQITPLAVLIAVLVTFGVLNRNSEIIAMKATGISLYRLVIPIVSISAVLAICLFFSTSITCRRRIAARRRCAAPSRAGRRKPFFILKHKWIFGQSHPGEPGHIFYYQFFDPDHNEFANLSIFEFDPSTFALSRRIFAPRVVWDEQTRNVALPERLGREIIDAKTTGVQRIQEHDVSLRFTRTRTTSKRKTGNRRR